MANNIKKLSVEEFKKATYDNYSPITTIEWNGINVVVRRNIDITEMIAFVENVTNTCFSTSDGTYMPELKDFAIRAVTVELYTNITMPEDLYERYNLLYSSDIWDVIMSNIDGMQYSNMLNAVKEKTKYIIDTNVMSINKNVNDAYKALDSIREQLSAVFDGIDPSDIRNLVGAISNGNIDEEKIVNAYIKNKQN